MRAPTTVVFPDGETWASLRERSKGAIESIAARSERQTTVAVTHLGVMLATLGLVLSVDDEDVFRFTLEHTHTCTLDVDDGARIVRSVNAAP